MSPIGLVKPSRPPVKLHDEASLDCRAIEEMSCINLCMNLCTGFETRFCAQNVCINLCMNYCIDFVFGKTGLKYVKCA